MTAVAVGVPAPVTTRTRSRFLTLWRLALLAVLASGVLSTASFALLALFVALLAGTGSVSAILLLGAIGLGGLGWMLARRHSSQDLVVNIVSGAMRRGNRMLRRPADSGLTAV